jgi:hypothetical protein
MKTLAVRTLVLALYLGATPVVGQTASGRPLSVIVLSDTQGVDFTLYVRQAIRLIDKSWSASSLQGLPDNFQSKTTIRFTISADGSIHSVELVESVHVIKVDRAAWGSITGVGQFPSLPAEFKGPSLVLDVDFQVKPTQ